MRKVAYVLIAGGLVMVVAAAYQVWGSNLVASRSQATMVQQLQASWVDRNPGARAHALTTRLEPGTAFAIVSIPRLQMRGKPSVFPLVEGDGRAQLDRGAVGHAPRTALPGQVGNFVLAGHRNGHGEPFRHLDQLHTGDAILIATADHRYTYILDKQLPRTEPSDVGVMDAVPAGLGVMHPGRYLTLITCTPQFSTRHRMIWWGHLQTAAVSASSARATTEGVVLSGD